MPFISAVAGELLDSVFSLGTAVQQKLWDVLQSHALLCPCPAAGSALLEAQPGVLCVQHIHTLFVGIALWDI